MERQDLENFPERQLAQRHHDGVQPRMIPHLGYAVFKREYLEKRLLRDPTWDFQTADARRECSIAYDNLEPNEKEEFTARGIQECQENQPPLNEGANIDADSHPIVIGWVGNGVGFQEPEDNEIEFYGYYASPRVGVRGYPRIRRIIRGGNGVQGIRGGNGVQGIRGGNGAQGRGNGNGIRGIRVQGYGRVGRGGRIRRFE